MRTGLSLRQFIWPCQTTCYHLGLMGSFWGPSLPKCLQDPAAHVCRCAALRTCIPQEGFAASHSSRSASLHNLVRARRNANWKGQIQRTHTHSSHPSYERTHTQSPLISPAVLRRGLPDPLQSVGMCVRACARVCAMCMLGTGWDRAAGKAPERERASQ